MLEEACSNKSVHDMFQESKRVLMKLSDNLLKKDSCWTIQKKPTMIQKATWCTNVWLLSGLVIVVA